MQKYPYETAQTSYGTIYRIPNDTNGNPRYIVAGENINALSISDKNRRQAGLRAYNKWKFQGFFSFSTYGPLEDHLYWIKSGIDARAKIEKEKDQYTLYLVASYNRTFEIIDTLESKDFTDRHALTAEKRRLYQEYQLAYHGYTDFSWSVLSNLPPSLKKEIKAELAQNNI